MLLTALHDYATSRRLLEDLPLQRRTLHALIPLDANGRLRLPHLISVTQPDENGKERAGMDYLLPRFPGENNGGKAYFLAESSIAIFGRDKKTGEPIPAPVATDAKKKDRNPTKAFLHFWEQVQIAFDATADKRLAAMLAFKQQAIADYDGLLRCNGAFLRMRAKDKGKKKGEPEFVANIGTDDSSYIVVEKATFGFTIDGVPVTLDDPDDPLRQYWFDLYTRLAFVGEHVDEPDHVESSPGSTASRATLCLVTGRTGQLIARSHKPKILGVPGIAAGGYIVSFAKAAPAFSSYGLEMGENSPVSEAAAASYALALTELLRDEEQHLSLGPIAVCSWTKATPQAGRQFNRLLNCAYPQHIRDFLRAPLAGDMEREVLNRERLYTVALSGNKGRVVIQHWLDQPLTEAIEHFRQWWDDLQIALMFPESETPAKTEKTKTGDGPPSPFAIPNLARATLRESKKQKTDKLVGERIVQLYRAALEETAPSLMLLKPILDEFHTALVKDDAKKPTYPFSQSRFALIKLILLRNYALPQLSDRKEGDFVQLADTFDEAYNCGRLLAVMEALQNRSRLAGKSKVERKRTDRPGGGVIARYYGRASTAPATVFPLLLGLSHHHESKLQKGNEADKKAASAFERRKIEILARLRPNANEPNSPPNFPKLLKLVGQGRFALGFYQQKAHDLEVLRRYRATQGQEGDDLAASEDDEQ